MKEITICPGGAGSGEQAEDWIIWGSFRGCEKLKHSQAVWMKVFCENTRESRRSQLEEPEPGLGETGKSPGTFAFPLFWTDTFLLPCLSAPTFNSSLLRTTSQFNHPLTNGNFLLQFNMTHQIVIMNQHGLHAPMLYSSRWQYLIGPSGITCPHLILSSVAKDIPFGTQNVAERNDETLIQEKVKWIFCCLNFISYSKNNNVLA